MASLGSFSVEYFNLEEDKGNKRSRSKWDIQKTTTKQIGRETGRQREGGGQREREIEMGERVRKRGRERKKESERKKERGREREVIRQGLW